MNQTGEKISAAKCPDCKQDMATADICLFPFVVINNKTYKRNTQNHDKNKRCHDCGILNGKVHHFPCDMEQCPRCKDQFAFCSCEKTLFKEFPKRVKK